jgi:nitrous-oxide reductase
MNGKDTNGELLAADPGRRKFLGNTALAGLAGTGAVLGLTACGAPQPTAQGAKAAEPSPATAAPDKYEVAPGKLDAYYLLSSGGHSGEVRVLGCPSGRTIKRIPVFNIDPMVGWGITNESKAIIGTRPDGQLNYWTGDTHHVHGSYEDGMYDGKYFWVNDKLNARVARIRGDTFETDKIVELPNVQGQHGLFPDKRDPVDASINRTTRVFAGAEFHIPVSTHIAWKCAGSAASTATWISSPPAMTASSPHPTNTTPKAACTTRT